MFTEPPVNDNEIYENAVLPFMLEQSGIRGRFVRLSKAVDTILVGHNYPEGVSRLLGELLVVATMIGSTIKTEGLVNIQTQGDGIVQFIVVDYTSDGHLRGYAGISESATDAQKEKLNKTDLPLSEILGTGYISITIDDELNGEQYQGIVELSGDSLTASLENYFRQSVQRDTAVSIAIDRLKPKGKRRMRWYAGGIMLQRTPKEGGKALKLVPKEGLQDESDTEDDWNRAHILLDTVKQEELLDPNISPNETLFRLFHEDGVLVYHAERLQAKCRCSRKKIERFLRNLSEAELREIQTETGTIEVVCQFCSKKEEFTVEGLLGE